MIKNMIDLKKHELDDNELSRKIVQLLDEDGFVVLKNTKVDITDISKVSKYFENLTALIGTHVQHDDNNKIVWDIKENSDSTSTIKTYSEHSDEALLHTDTQYRDNPEDYMALFMIKPANCLGGETHLLTLKDIIKEINKLDNADKILGVLKEENYPFVVPSVFNQEGKGETQYVFAPILKEDTIRFRVDTLEKALVKHKDILSPEALDAFYTIKSIVTNSQYIKKFHLESNDLIIVNNKTVLHGRTAFKDSSRHLLRIRFNKKVAS